MHNKKIIFLFINQNICCGYTKELSQRDGSFEHPKQMLKLTDKKLFLILHSKLLSIWACHVDFTPLPIVSYHSLIKVASVFYFLYIFDSYLFIVQVCCKYSKYLY